MIPFSKLLQMLKCKEEKKKKMRRREKIDEMSVTQGYSKIKMRLNSG